ncbi:MAG: VCBS repeat-containing protein, partial [Verrucomicrobiota bacterium]
LYVSNMFSAAGNRITYQRQFQTSTNEEVKNQFQRHARGNSLFRNMKGTFKDVSVDSAITMGRWAWGSRFVDFNNDGWDDILVANGFITTEDTGDL